MTEFDRWLKVALQDMMRALDDSLKSAPDLQQALALFFDEKHNPLGLRLQQAERDFLAAHILARTQAQNETLHELLHNDKAALIDFLCREDSALGQQRREYLKDLNLFGVNLPEDALQTLSTSLIEGAAADDSLFAAGAQTKAALSALNYALLRSGLLAEEYDDVHADALIAGVCAMVDIIAALSAISQKQTTFTVTRRMLRCAYLAFLMCACEGALTPDLAYLLSACTCENALELPQELARAMVGKPLLHRALLLAAEQLPLQLKAAKETEALAPQLIVPAGNALSAIARLTEAQAAAASTRLPEVAAAPPVFADEPELPDEPIF